MYFNVKNIPTSKNYMELKSTIASISFSDQGLILTFAYSIRHLGRKNANYDLEKKPENSSFLTLEFHSLCKNLKFTRNWKAHLKFPLNNGNSVEWYLAPIQVFAAFCHSARLEHPETLNSYFWQREDDNSFQ